MADKDYERWPIPTRPNSPGELERLRAYAAAREQEPTPEQLAERVHRAIDAAVFEHEAEQRIARSALSELVARLATAETARDKAERRLQAISECRPYNDCNGDCGERGMYCCDGLWDEPRRRHRAEADRDQLAAALEQYADPLHWGIQRDEFKHPSAVWIGPGATETPHPNPMLVAREALAPQEQQ